MASVTMPDGAVVDMPDTLDPALGQRLRAFHDSQNRVSGTQEALLGPTELLGSTIGNIPHAAAHAAVDLYRRVTGGNLEAPEPAAVSALKVPAGKAGTQLASDIGKGMNIGGSQGPTNPPEAEAQAAQINGPLTAPPLSENARDTISNVTGHVASVLGDVGNLLPAAGVVKRGVGIASDVADAAAARAAATPAAVTKYGMQTGENSPIARNVAGASARPAVAAHNQAIADPVLGAQAGVSPGTKLTSQSLEDARGAPNSVYERAETSIPTGPLSPTAAQAVQGVGADDMIVHSPDTQATIEAQKARLLSGPLTGSQVVNAQRALRFNGFRNVGAEDPEMNALGQAQLKMSDALHQHMVDTLPPDAPVSADQLAAARVALAQNHTVENVLGPNGNINLAKLAKLHNDNPGMLSGPMQEIAQFASDHPEVTRLPSDTERFNPSGVVKDVASIDLKKPLSYIQPLFGAAARRTLTGPAPALAPKVTGLGGEFGPIERGPPQPPPDMSASPPSAPPAAPAGPPGQIPLADLLSHGVEQQPAAGLTAGPMGAAPASGVPFTRNAAHEAGGLSLADELTRLVQSYPDLAKVASQGVPEDIMQRAPAQGPRPKVAHAPAFIENNGSGESAASLEAQSRGTKNLVEVDPDGNEHPVLRDVTQADIEPSPRHLIVDKSTGEIVKSGGMAPALARGLLNRWKSMQLGNAF
jgi:hypothetical protein